MKLGKYIFKNSVNIKEDIKENIKEDIKYESLDNDDNEFIENNYDEDIENNYNEYINEKNIEDVRLDIPHITREQIEDIIGMKPRDVNIYRKAFINSSFKATIDKQKKKNIKMCDYFNEYNNDSDILEYLGDAVLNLVAADYLIKKFPDKDEGFLTRIRTKIVRGTNCVYLCKKINITKYILCESLTDDINDKIIEDTFEALIGAIYKDLGYEYVYNFLDNIFNKYMNLVDIIADTNYKNMLYKYAKDNKKDMPIYDINIYNDLYYVTLKFDNIKSKIINKNKKYAEQLAAKEICKKINVKYLINKDYNN